MGLRFLQAALIHGQAPEEVLGLLRAWLVEEVLPQDRLGPGVILLAIVGARDVEPRDDQVFVGRDGLLEFPDRLVPSPLAVEDRAAIVVRVRGLDTDDARGALRGRRPAFSPADISEVPELLEAIPIPGF